MKTDRELFKEIYEENFQYVYSFIYARLSGKVESVEDLVQNVFISAMNSMNSFKGKSSYRTWLCSIARHKIIDYYRKEISNASIEYIDDLSDIENNEHIENIVINKELKTVVIKVLLTLPPVYKYAIILKYVDNYSVKEIADILEKTPKSIDGILQRGKLKFKNEFLKLEGELL